MREGKQVSETKTLFTWTDLYPWESGPADGIAVYLEEKGDPRGLDALVDDLAEGVNGFLEGTGIEFRDGVFRGPGGPTEEAEDLCRSAVDSVYVYDL